MFGDDVLHRFVSIHASLEAYDSTKRYHYFYQHYANEHTSVSMRLAKHQINGCIMRAKAAAVSPFFSGLYPDVFLTEKPRGIYGPTERIADKLDTITIEWNKSVEEKIYKRERTLVHIPPAAIYC